ncbi:hypothetical protein [Bacillus sp. mrc49]|uniref:hypothetical protein n=1 Tax=Bacillus sp. mrc49 TaxID=2054913 RepID=UPI0012FDD3C4|nr:hypothetical protein [Bacillus sp. mrc49]
MHTITKDLSAIIYPQLEGLYVKRCFALQLKAEEAQRSTCSAMERTKYQSSKIESNQDSTFMFKQKWNGTEGARLLREMRVYLRLRRLNAEEAQGPPAERERLQCNGTD